MPQDGSARGRRQPRHIVIFDVNVYLDVARLLGPPFTWDKFNEATARVARAAVPHPSDVAQDSLRAVAACTSGLLAGAETLEVFTNSHIDKLVRGKACESVVPDPETGYHGLDWAQKDADTLITDLVYGLLERSHGETLGDTFPDGNPPLDHEDGMVFGACRLLAGNDPLSTVYCVTRDRKFREQSEAGRISNHTKVLHPTTFLQFVRAARFRQAVPRMRPKT